MGARVRSCSNVTPSKLVEFKKLDNEATLKTKSMKQKKSHYHLYLMKETRLTVMLTQNSKVLYKLLSIFK